jgi:hypothetical protein
MMSSRVTITLEGAFQTDELLTFLAQPHSEDIWTYCTLYELRGATGHPTVADVQQIMSEVAERQRGKRPRGPVAILATDPILYDHACT